MIGLSVPANYDLEAVSELAQYPVSEVYGRLPADGFGGGRAGYMAAPLRWRGLADYVKRLQANGIGFNYLLNSACLGNREWSRSFHKKLNRLLGRLQAIGVHRLTLSTPFLLEAIRARFPDFYIRVGIYAQVDTPKRARFWQELGADAITLESFSINRDFKRLAAIRQAVDCELQLIANHPCLPNCPMQPYHQNGFAHGSDGSGRLFIDYCFLRCTRKRLADPSLFIRSMWIRPEDIPFYQELGYDRFKLIERDIPSPEILKRVRAYSRMRFDGDLGELILPYGFATTGKARAFGALRHLFKPLAVNPLRIARHYPLMQKQGWLHPVDHRPVTIDNQRIRPDFIHGFKGRRCVEHNCRDCGYCQAVAKAAVTVDPAFQRDLLERFARLEKEMRDGSLWGV